MTKTTDNPLIRQCSAWESWWQEATSRRQHIQQSWIESCWLTPQEARKLQQEDNDNLKELENLINHGQQLLQHLEEATWASGIKRTPYENSPHDNIANQLNSLASASLLAGNNRTMAVLREMEEQAIHILDSCKTNWKEVEQHHQQIHHSIYNSGLTHNSLQHRNYQSPRRRLCPHRCHDLINILNSLCPPDRDGDLERLSYHSGNHELISELRIASMVARTQQLLSTNPDYSEISRHIKQEVAKFDDSKNNHHMRLRANSAKILPVEWMPWALHLIMCYSGQASVRETTSKGASSSQHEINMPKPKVSTWTPDHTERLKQALASMKISLKER